jgi:hypothetical protein
VGFNLVAGDSPDSSTFQIVIAVIERLSHLEQLVYASRSRIFHKVISPASALRAEAVEFLLGFRCEVYFHARTMVENWGA